MRTLARILLLYLLMPAVWALEAKPDEGPLPMKKVGARTFIVGDKGREITWYRVEADYKALRFRPEEHFERFKLPDGSMTARKVVPHTIWERIPTPEGTVSAYVGTYGPHRWCQWRGNNEHRMVSALMVNFIGPDYRQVKPGPGDVHVRWWLHAEEPRDDDMEFRRDRFYVFCLDRKPVGQWMNGAGEAACDMRSEMDHVIGIVEVVPAFDFTIHPKSDALHVTFDTFVSFREERFVGEEGYELELEVRREKDGTFVGRAKEGEQKPIDRDTVQQLLYALNTAEWHRRDEAHSYERFPPVLNAIVEYKDVDGKVVRANIGYDRGGWYLTLPDGRHYAASYPDILHDLKERMKTPTEEADD